MKPDIEVCLVGTHPTKIDAAGRIRLPADWKPDAGWKGCELVLVSLDGEKISILFPGTRLHRVSLQSLQVKLALPPLTVPVDARGRLTLPAHVREMAGLEDLGVLAGCFESAELWSPARWAAREKTDAGIMGEALKFIGL